jgi:diguanylate cyclase (GGDEF)-like protein/PAS domain S-box-containing protein
LLYTLGGSLALVCIMIAGYIYLRITRIISMLNHSRNELRAINIELKENERRERAIRENTLEAIITIDQRGRITSCNPAVESMFGYQSSELIGQNISMLTPEPVRSQHDFYLQRYLQTGQPHIIGNNREVEARKRDGTLFPVELGVTEINQGGERHFIGVLHDVTEHRITEQALLKVRDELELRVAERTEELLNTNQLLRSEISEHKQTQSKLAHLANHDPLTGLPNRTLFNEHLKLILTKADRHQEQAALLYIDLDGFKPINDQLGHAEGDRMLQEVAQRLSDTVRQEDLVARIGGDEFTVILGYTADIHDKAAKVADKILHSLQAPFLLQGREYRIGASIGISLYRTDAETPTAMQQHADQAMYAVKRANKGSYCFYLDLPETADLQQDAS